MTQYTSKEFDRPYIAFGALGDGWFGEGLYRLKVREIKKLNNRDFGKNDMSLTDSKVNRHAPLKVLFINLKVINPQSLNEDKDATKAIQHYVQNYKFRGSLGIGEAIVENSRNGIYDNKPSSAGSYSLVKKEKGNLDGIMNHYISCGNGGIRIITKNKSIGFYADSNNNKHDNFNAAAQASCRE